MSAYMKKCLFWFQQQHIANEVTQPLGKKRDKNQLFQSAVSMFYIQPNYISNTLKNS